MLLIFISVLIFKDIVPTPTFLKGAFKCYRPHPDQAFPSERPAFAAVTSLFTLKMQENLHLKMSSIYVVC